MASGSKAPNCPPLGTRAACSECGVLLRPWRADAVPHLALGVGRGFRTRRVGAPGCTGAAPRGQRVLLIAGEPHGTWPTAPCVVESASEMHALLCATVLSAVLMSVSGFHETSARISGFTTCPGPCRREARSPGHSSSPHRPTQREFREEIVVPRHRRHVQCQPARLRGLVFIFLDSAL